MTRHSIRAKTKGNEFEAFNRKARNLIKWSRGEISAMKRRFWRRMRRKLKAQVDDAGD